MKEWKLYKISPGGRQLIKNFGSDEQAAKKEFDKMSKELNNNPYNLFHGYPISNMMLIFEEF